MPSSASAMSELILSVRYSLYLAISEAADADSCWRQ